MPRNSRLPWRTPTLLVDGLLNLSALLPVSVPFRALWLASLLLLASPRVCAAEDPLLRQAFARAFEEATAADWPAAIASYQKAWELAPYPCDRQLARAGQRASREAWFAQRLYGMGSRPTQLFWSRYQYLTNQLPCAGK
jgi:hypothetical protein